MTDRDAARILWDHFYVYRDDLPPMFRNRDGSLVHPSRADPAEMAAWRDALMGRDFRLDLSRVNEGARILSRPIQLGIEAEKLGPPASRQE